MHRHSPAVRAGRLGDGRAMGRKPGLVGVPQAAGLTEPEPCRRVRIQEFDVALEGERFLERIGDQDKMADRTGRGQGPNRSADRVRIGQKIPE